MNMKDLKMYETPAVEIVELEAKNVLLAGSGTNADNVDVINPGEE